MNNRLTASYNMILSNLSRNGCVYVNQVCFAVFDVINDDCDPPLTQLPPAA